MPVAEIRPSDCPGVTGPNAQHCPPGRWRAPGSTARGADLAITSAIDARIETAKASQGHPGDGTPQVQLKSGNGPLMAPEDQQDANKPERHVRRGS